jgi:hypothetical protein
MNEPQRTARIVGRAIVIVLVGAALGGAAFIWHKLDSAGDQIRCQEQLGRGLYQSVRQQDGTFLSVADFVKSPMAGWLCEGCGRAYVYQPLANAIRHSTYEGRPIAWCPVACHSGKRVVLLESGATILMTESEFQHALKAGSAVSTTSTTATAPVRDF